MKTRPILFNAPMVRAILSSQKTQTRRVMREQVCAPGIVQITRPGYCEIVNEHGVRIPGFRCTYGQPGDRLYVREAWRTTEALDLHPPRELGPSARIWFEADAPHQPGFGKHRQSMHMPKWASRITLEITGVRVERLQDISEADAIAEGCSGGHGSIPGYAFSATPREHYMHVWESTGGNWAANPWVWVIEFQRLAP